MSRRRAARVSRELFDQLIELVARHRLRELVYTNSRTRIRLVKQEDAPGTAVASSQSGLIRSGGTGIFHSTHPLGGKVSVREGEIAAQGQIIAYVRMGTVLRPVIAPFDGRVRKQVLPDGAAVGHGERLYLFEAAAVSSMCRQACSQSAPTGSRGLPGSAS